MSGNKSDDYWNRSSSSGFNFDDDDDNTKGHITNSTFNFESNSLESAFASHLDIDSYTLPIQTVISKNNLDAILNDISCIKLPCQDIKETIRRMILRLPYDLLCYRSLKEKEELLDESLNSMDGDIILDVLLYLYNTLNFSIFCRVLSKRKIATDHYINYLKVKLQTEQLSNLFLTLGCNSEMIEIFFMTSFNVHSSESNLTKLQQFMMEHSGEIISEKEKTFLHDYRSFLKWKIAEKSSSQSVAEELAKLCKLTWSNKIINENKILEFKKLFKISDMQYEWILLNVLASSQLWDKILSNFIKTNWLTKRSVIKSVIDPQLLLLGLFKHDPPKNIITEFLNCLVDNETSFQLAKQMKCHKFAVDFFINQRDRLGLILYKNHLPQQSEEFFFAESALHSSNVKWKN